VEYPAVRDLERIRELREYQVTGPQLASLLGLAVLCVMGAFLLGVQVGIWRKPVDEALLQPVATDAEAREVLARMLAVRGREGELAGAGRSGDGAVLGDWPKTESGRGLARRGAADAAAAGAAALEAAAASEDRPPIAVEGEPGEGADLGDAGDGGDAPPGLLAIDETRPSGPDPAEGSAASEGPPEEIAIIEIVPTPSARPEATPTAQPEPSPAPAAARPASAGSDAALPQAPPGEKGFTVQVAAYESATDASSLITKLRGLGYPAFHVSATVDGRTWHRVRVGIYSDRAQAEALAQRLDGSTPFPPYVTKHP
jgi:cell division septation protein DedD